MTRPTPARALLAFAAVAAAPAAAAAQQSPIVAYGCGDETVRLTAAHLDYIPDPERGLPAAERDELRAALEAAHASSSETVVDVAFAPSCRGFVLLTDERWIVRNIGRGDARTDATQFVDKGGVPRTHFLEDFRGGDGFDPRDDVRAFALDPFRWSSVKNYAVATRPMDELAGSDGAPRAHAFTPGVDMHYGDLPGGGIYHDLIEAFRDVFENRGGEEIVALAFVPRPDRASGWAFVTESGYYHVRGVGERAFPGGFTRDADGNAIRSHLFGAIEDLRAAGVDIVDITVAPDSADAPDWMIADADGCFYANGFYDRFGLHDMNEAAANAAVEAPENMFFQVSMEHHRGTWADKARDCPVRGAAEASAPASRLDIRLPGVANRREELGDILQRDDLRGDIAIDALKEESDDDTDAEDRPRTPREMMEMRREMREKGEDDG